MKLETWMYKQALELYPKVYREQFGQPMLETYTDGLRAAKLEGEVWAFHRHTTVDMVKGIFKATKEIEKPDVLARVAAVLAFIYACYCLVINPLFGANPQFRLKLSFEVIAPVIHIIGFMLAFRRPFSEWIYFALMSVLGAIRILLDFYLGTYDWSFQRFQLPDLVYQLFVVRGWLSWGMFLTLPLFILLRSKEQKRLSKLFWFFLMNAFVWLGYLFVPARQVPRSEFHIHDVLFWTASVTGAIYFLMFALKFWQRTRPEPRVIKTT